MAASAEQIARLRRLVAEPGSTTYSDIALAAVIESHAVSDASGRQPLDASWSPTYDLYAAGAEVWEEKAAAAAGLCDVSVDGTTLSRSQVVRDYERQAAKCRARSRVTSTTMISHREEEVYEGLDALEALPGVPQLPGVQLDASLVVNNPQVIE